MSKLPLHTLVWWYDQNLFIIMLFLHLPTGDDFQHVHLREIFNEQIVLQQPPGTGPGGEGSTKAQLRHRQLQSGSIHKIWRNLSILL